MLQVTFGHATVELIGNAKPFTIFKGNRKGEKKGGGEYWAIFEVSWDGFTEAVYDRLDELGVDMDGECEPEYFDEFRKEHGKSDEDAWIPALEDGWDLMKIPYDIGSKHYRLMVASRPEA